MNFKTVDWVKKIRNENNKNLNKAQKIKKNLAKAFLDQNKKSRPLKSKI